MDLTDDEICLLWQETEMVPERRRPENRWMRQRYDSMKATSDRFQYLMDRLIFRYEVRMAVIAAGLETE